MELGHEPEVGTVAHVFKEMCYNYRDSLSAGIIVAGWDKKKGGQVSYFSLLPYLRFLPPPLSTIPALRVLARI